MLFTKTREVSEQKSNFLISRSDLFCCMSLNLLVCILHLLHPSPFSALLTNLIDESQFAIAKLNDLKSDTKLIKALSALSLLDLQFLLYSCEAEERYLHPSSFNLHSLSFLHLFFSLLIFVFRSWSKGASGTYVLENYGAMAYAGIVGVVTILDKIR